MLENLPTAKDYFETLYQRDLATYRLGLQAQSERDIWQSLAQRYQAVEVTLADCGCFCVEFFAANGIKICEEDKDLLTALTAAEKKAAEVSQ